MRKPRGRGKQSKKQSGIKSISRSLAQCHAVVIGAGPVGRQIAILLASLGVQHMSLYDPGIVSTKHLAQGFMEFDLGMSKVDAVANITHQQNPQMELLTFYEQFQRSHLLKWKPSLCHAVFICVETAAARKTLWKQVRHAAQFQCVVSMEPKVVRVFCAENTSMGSDGPPNSMANSTHYMTRCSCQLVMDWLSAGLMIEQFMRWLNSSAPET